MTKKSLLSVIAGVADTTFDIGAVKFWAAPLTILEYAEYLNVSAGQVDDAMRRPFAGYPKVTDDDIALYDFLAGKLRLRLVSAQQVGGKPLDPITLTALWLATNLPQSLMNTLLHILIHGKRPEIEEKKTSP